VTSHLKFEREITDGSPFSGWMRILYNITGLHAAYHLKLATLSGCVVYSFLIVVCINNPGWLLLLPLKRDQAWNKLPDVVCCGICGVWILYAGYIGWVMPAQQMSSFIINMDSLWLFVEDPLLCIAGLICWLMVLSLKFKAFKLFSAGSLEYPFSSDVAVSAAIAVLAPPPVVDAPRPPIGG